MTISAALAFASSLLVTWFLLPHMRSLAFRLGAVDHPGARRVHRSATPRLGGLAIFAGVCAGISVGAMLAVRIAGGEGLAWCDGLFSVAVALGACFMILGFVDDVRGLSARFKLSVEAVLALILFGAGGKITALELPGLGVVELATWPSLALTVLWVTTVTNAFNLIDGVNGLAGGVAMITSLAIVAIAAGSGAGGALLIGAVMAGAITSFLRLNLRPNGIFLGDSGSLYVGFMLSAATLFLARNSGQVLFPDVAILLVGLPLVEVGTTIVRRGLASRAWRRGLRGLVAFATTDLVHPDAGHLHHRLIRFGLRAGSTAGLLVGAAAVYAISSVALALAPHHAQAFLAGVGLVTAACCVVSLARPRAPGLVQPGLPAPEGPRIVPFPHEAAGRAQPPSLEEDAPSLAA